MSTSERIHTYIAGQGIPVVSVVEDTPGVYRAVLDATATPAQVSAASSACASPPAPTASQALDEIPMLPRALAALVLRASSSWSSLTATQQAAVQRVIDNAGASILGRLP